MRVFYQSERGGAPFRLNINLSKRVVRSADERDQRAVLEALGPGLPRQRRNHQALVRARHGAYALQYREPAYVQPAAEQGERERARRRRQLEASIARAWRPYEYL